MDKISYWHFHRDDFTRKLVTSIEVGATQCFTIFAPRRVGKTEFLNYDLKPALIKDNCEVIYYSFYSNPADSAIRLFMDELRKNINVSLLSKLKVTEISTPWCKVNLKLQDLTELSILELITILTHQNYKNKKHLVFLFDEIQELLNIPDASGFIGGLRTALDLNKEFLSVVFTGSSQDGLQKMFNDRRAPFFHFSMNLQMPLLGKEFTDFLAQRYKERTKSKIDGDELYLVFEKLGFITEYIRSIITMLTLEPKLTITEAYTRLISNLNNSDRLEYQWSKLSAIEKALCHWITAGNSTFYTEDFKMFALNTYEVDTTQGKIQYAINKLQQHDILTTNMEDILVIENEFFRDWIRSNILV